MVPGLRPVCHWVFLEFANQAAKQGCPIEFHREVESRGLAKWKAQEAPVAVASQVALLRIGEWPIPAGERRIRS